MKVDNNSLANKFRPDRFEDVLGQSIWVDKLAKRVRENRIPRVIIIGGPSGTGKTTTARIVAKAAVCLNRPNGTHNPCNTCVECLGVDNGGTATNYMFLDGGSGDLADTVRTDLRITIDANPIGGARHKCCIIDEFQAFSGTAKAALLTIFEELPKTSIIICTTMDLKSIHDALRHRSYEIEFAPIPTDKQVEGVLKFMPELKSNLDRITQLAKFSGGTQRKLWAMIDQLDGDFSEKTLRAITKTVNSKTIDAVIEACINRDLEMINRFWRYVTDNGLPMSNIMSQLIDDLCDKAVANPDNHKYTKAIRILGQAAVLDKPEVYRRALFTIGEDV